MHQQVDNPGDLVAGEHRSIYPCDLVARSDGADHRAVEQVSVIRLSPQTHDPAMHLLPLEPLDQDDVRLQVGQGQIGRPHIARAMVAKGFVQSIDEAFDGFLGTDKSAYVNKYRIECAKAVQTIRAAGGIPVLAHPGLLKISNADDLNHLVGNLKEIGIRGIEVYYPEHTSQQTKQYAELAERYELLMTGGTDFHGATIPGIEMGTGNGNLFIPYELYERLMQN